MENPWIYLEHEIEKELGLGNEISKFLNRAFQMSSKIALKSSAIGIYLYSKQQNAATLRNSLRMIGSNWALQNK